MGTNFSTNFAGCHNEDELRARIQQFYKLGTSKDQLLEVVQILKTILERSDNKFLSKAIICECFVEIIQFHKDNSRVMLKLCSVLADIAVNRDINILLGKAGVCEKLVALLHVYGFSYDDDVMSSLFEALYYVSNNGDNSILLGEAGLLNALYSIMGTSFGKHSLLGFRVLCNFSHHDDSKILLGNDEACQYLNRVLWRDENHDETVTLYVCCIAYNMMVGHDNIKILLGNAGLCETLVKRLHIHKNNVDIVGKCCAALDQLSVIEENRARIGESGGCKCELLQFFWNKPEVMMHICGVWGTMKMTEYYRKVLIADGACKCLVDIIRDHKNNAKLIALSCLALGKIADIGRSCSTLGIDHEKTCQYLAEVLRIHKNYVDVVGYVVIALISMIAENNYNSKIFLGKAGVCETLLRILRIHKDNPEMMNVICGLISAIINDNETNLNLLCNGGACEVLVEVIRIHKEDMNVISKAYGILCSVALGREDDDGGIFDMKSTACKLLVEVLTIHQNHSDVIILCGELWKIFQIGQNSIVLYNAGLCECFIDIIQLRTSCAAYITPICEMLCNLLSNPIIQMVFCNRIICELIVGVIHLYQEDYPLVLQCCRIWHNLLFNAGNIIFFCSPRTCEVLGVLMQKHRMSADIIALVCGIVRGFPFIRDNSNLLDKSEICKSFRYTMHLHVDNIQLINMICSTILYFALNDENKVLLAQGDICKGLVLLLNKVQNNNNDPRVRIVCETIYVLSDCDEIKNLLTKCHECIMYLTQIIHLYTDDVALASQVLRTFGNLASNTNRNGGSACTGVVAVMGIHKHDMNFIVEACEILRKIESNSDNWYWLVAKEGNCQCFIELLNLYQTHEGIVGSICGTLAVISTHNGGSKLFEAGICDCLVRLFRTYKTNAKLMYSICDVFLNISREKENILPLVRTGVYEFMMEMLRVDENNPEILLPLLQLLKNFSDTCDNQILLDIADVCVALVQIMRSHMNNSDFIEYGCSSLLKIAFHDGNKSILVSSSTCECFVEVLIFHKNNAELMVKICGFLEKIVFGPDNDGDVVLGQVGACNVLMDAFRIHIRNQNVIPSVCRALLALTVKKPNQDLLLKLDVCKYLLETVRFSSYVNSTINAAVYKVLSIISLNEGCKFFLCNDEFCEEVVNVAKWNFCDQDMNLNICSVLLNISREECLFGNEGVCERIADFLRYQKEFPKVIEMVCAVAWNMSMDDHNKLFLGKYGMCGLLGEAADKYKYDPLLLRKICGTLWHLSMHPGVKGLLLRAKICEKMAALVEMYKNNANCIAVCHSAVFVLFNLCKTPTTKVVLNESILDSWTQDSTFDESRLNDVWNINSDERDKLFDKLANSKNCDDIQAAFCTVNLP